MSFLKRFQKRAETLPPASQRSVVGAVTSGPQAEAEETPEVAPAEPRIDPVSPEAQGLLEARAEGRLFVSDYPYEMRQRPYAKSIGGRKILGQLVASHPRIDFWLDEIQRYLPDLKRIPKIPEGDEPGWINGMFPTLDGMVLYAMVRTLKPATYLEVGSGNSTKFARRAIRDGGLDTQIISIDPHPRAEIDRICDKVIRRPFEKTPDRLYGDLLKANDIVFIDNSHRSLPNSDVTVFFTETLPALPAGVMYGLHDVFLPKDYPEAWMDRFYNEQYLLAAYLLGGGGGDQIEFPGIYASDAKQFRPTLLPIYRRAAFKGAAKHAGAFWLRRGEG
jgi:hypothetical protein